jgi:ribosomal protein L11 methyltransferase
VTTSARLTNWESIDCRLAIAELKKVSAYHSRQSAIANRQSSMSEIRNPQSEIRNSSSWWLVTVDVARDGEEVSSALLFDMGAGGIVTLDESLDRVRLGAYFDDRTKADGIKPALEAELERLGLIGSLGELCISPVPLQDWMQKWKEGFEAVEIGERLIVAPSWKLPASNADRVVIQIDPGMAFGTGTHETTRLCLEAIERHWRGGCLLDVGTGTGILAIAAALLSPEPAPRTRRGVRVVAIDVDPQAVEVARENTEINKVSDLIELREAQPGQFAGEGFDVVVANLTAEVIVDLMNDLAACLAPRGLMILSGILIELAADVERALVTSGFAITERHEAGEWSALVAQGP